MNLIIDTDCSFDDCLAILLLLLYQKKNTNKLKLDLLSLVGGINKIENGLKIMYKIDF